jgi:hypothetical protein
MNPIWHILISHGPKLLIVAIGLWGHYMGYRRKKADKEKALRPPQSAPAAPSMAPQQLTDTTKNDSSPWSNADPFNSQRPRR